METAQRKPLTLEQRDAAIEQVMDRYHHVGPNHIPDNDPVGECGDCADIVGMFLVVERYAVEQAMSEHSRAFQEAVQRTLAARAEADRLREALDGLMHVDHGDENSWGGPCACRAHAVAHAALDAGGAS